THSYSATVKVYGSKNGKADLNNVIATKKVTINLKGKHNHKDHNHMGHKPSNPMNQGHMDKGNMGSHQGHMHSGNQAQAQSGAIQTPNTTTNLSNGKAALPNTGESTKNLTLAGIVGLILVSILGFFGIRKRSK
uniref:LPXTG cell wall anchor domain-containing protein n=1 Tax=Gemella cuniculi TaxID=150240 RepID=UPI0005561140